MSLELFWETRPSSREHSPHGRAASDPAGASPNSRNNLSIDIPKKFNKADFKLEIYAINIKHLGQILRK